MKPKLIVEAKVPGLSAMPAKHVLVVVPPGARNIFAGDALAAVRARQGAKPDSKPKPVSADVDGRLVAWVELAAGAGTFERQTALRKALQLLLKESPQSIAVVAANTADAADAIYVAVANGAYELGRPLTGKEEAGRLKKLHVYGTDIGPESARALAVAAGNLLARSLILRPANDLTPVRYRKDIATLATQYGWKIKQYDFDALKKMGAGAFCAVAQGSGHRDAAIVHLAYRPKAAKKAKAGAPVALVGKGICMDTGGHSLKSAKGMYGMHEDMAGSAVVLGILAAATQLELPVPIDAWLAISQNHIGPHAYHPGDVVTALDGTRIEVVHTDAEGRMVLADTLTMAAKAKPSVVIDFATLTGAMVYSLGTRMSGVFTNRNRWAERAVAAGHASGERVGIFPMEPDYDEALESKVADIKQCLIAGEADAIYAARFLSRFVGDTPWLHVDLSAYRNEGGLGAVADEVNGFGVALGVHLLGVAGYK